MKSVRVAAAFAAGVVGVAAWAGEARADDAEVMATRHHNLDSPQNFALELRVGPYTPQIDQDPALQGKTPYATVFGDSERWEVAAEFDWQVLRIPYFGTLGPGFGIGYTSSTAKAIRVDNGQPSGEDTSLDIFPFYAVAVLRVDTFMRNAHIPLVPYAKAGIGYALWHATNTLGTSLDANGVSGKGHSVGTHFALGGMLQLNAFDPHAARELDQSTGVNNTYLFGEYMWSDLNGLGQSSALFVGADTFVFGLAFEF